MAFVGAVSLHRSRQFQRILLGLLGSCTDRVTFGECFLGCRVVAPIASMSANVFWCAGSLHRSRQFQRMFLGRVPGRCTDRFNVSECFLGCRVVAPVAVGHFLARLYTCNLRVGHLFVHFVFENRPLVTFKEGSTPANCELVAFSLISHLKIYHLSLLRKASHVQPANWLISYLKINQLSFLRKVAPASW